MDDPRSQADGWHDEEGDVNDWRGDVHLADWPVQAAGPEYHLVQRHLAQHIRQEECPVCDGRGWISVVT